MPLPNCVIAGAPRCGTTSLFRWMARHPAALVPRRKETRYLIDQGYPLFDEASNFLSGGLEGYARLFPEPAGDAARLCLEATPDYMYQRTALSVLAELPTRPRIVFLLRNPVERIMSLFGYAMNNVGSLDARLSAREFFVAARSGAVSGDEIVDCAVSHSVYDQWLEQWFAGVGRSRVDVYFFEDLVAQPLAVMRQICDKLGVDGRFYDGFNFTAENPTIQVRSVRLSRAKRMIERRAPRLTRIGILKVLYRAVNVRSKAPHAVTDAELTEEIRKHFAEPNRRLARLLGRDLPPNWL